MRNGEIHTEQTSYFHLLLETLRLNQFISCQRQSLPLLSHHLA